MGVGVGVGSGSGVGSGLVVEGVPKLAVSSTSWSGMVNSSTRLVLCSSVSSRPVQFLNTLVSVSGFAVALSSVPADTAVRSTSSPFFMVTCALLTFSAKVGGTGSGVVVPFTT